MTPRTLLALALGAPLLFAGCVDAESDPSAGDDDPAMGVAPTTRASNSVVRLLAEGQPVFGIFSQDHSREGGMAAIAGQRADFQLYSMESGPFDVDSLAAYLAGMREAGGEAAVSEFPVIVRTPAIHLQPEAIAEYVESAMATGIAGITFPHVTSAAEAARSVELLGSPWPLDPDGEAVDVLIVEDRAGIAAVREIVATPGLSVVFAGPGDLRRAYEGDMEAVENAIQQVLAACLEFDVACGVTAGVDDIQARLDQGFRVIIVTEPEAVEVGMAHAGRVNSLTR